MNTEYENTENTTPTSRPLGYWLRIVDRLIAREFETAFADEDITRRDWRILNVLDGDVDAPELIEHLERRGKKLRRLVDRGWVTETEGSWTLTDEGRAAKERLSAAVTGIRTKVAGSVPDEDFATAVRTLEAIARELGWDESAPERGFSRGLRGFGHGGQRGHRRRGFGPALDADYGPGERFAPGRSHVGPRGFGRGDDCGREGRDGFGHGRDRGGREHRAAERAYERGFDAGFTRGRDAQTA
ncbi:MarR family winged helix-turn-helix transcriptional regulator [Microbacterium invictum]|uniref:HTH marR-type domain-containing protein n=1 Tax=Microbacterium invictum TaxID=515415 RepID=A0AA40SRD7_9MICO|nr:hypothetical protein [Microbacterium invictum]MBB4140862.1 hypothetical protein [Microbacterium invictum]